MLNRSDAVNWKLQEQANLLEGEEEAERSKPKILYVIINMF